MLFFEHLIIAMCAAIVLSYFIKNFRKTEMLLAFGLGSVISDLIDKPTYFIYGTGRSAMHSIVIVTILLIILLIIFRKNRYLQIISAFVYGSAIMFHIFLDKMWTLPQIFLFPLLGNPYPYYDMSNYAVYFAAEFTLSEFLLAAACLAIFAITYITEAKKV